MKIAILENDTAAAQLMEDWLRLAGHETRFFASGAAFCREVDRASFDVAILGSVSADMRMAEICSAFRAGYSHVPLIRILQRGTEQDIVAALKAGADDCMANLREYELLARLESLTWRASANQAPVDQLMQFGNLSVDLRNRVITRDGERVTLTPKTYNLAVFLLSNTGKLLSRSYLLEQIWGREKNASTRTLDTHISRLRTVLGLMPQNGWQLQSVYQHGYRLDRIENGRVSTRNVLSRELAAAA